MWKLRQWSKTNVLVSPQLWCDANRLLLCVFSVSRPASPNLGYITPRYFTELTSLCFWNFIQIQTALVNPKFGHVWDEIRGFFKIRFSSKRTRGTEWLTSFQWRNAFLCQRPYRKAKISKKRASKQMYYSSRRRHSAVCRSAAFWRRCCRGPPGWKSEMWGNADPLPRAAGRKASPQD